MAGAVPPLRIAADAWRSICQSWSACHGTAASSSNSSSMMIRGRPESQKVLAIKYIKWCTFLDGRSKAGYVVGNVVGATSMYRTQQHQHHMLVKQVVLRAHLFRWPQPGRSCSRQRRRCQRAPAAPARTPRQSLWIPGSWAARHTRSTGQRAGLCAGK